LRFTGSIGALEVTGESALRAVIAALHLKHTDFKTGISIAGKPQGPHDLNEANDRTAVDIVFDPSASRDQNAIARLRNTSRLPCICIRPTPTSHRLPAKRDVFVTGVVVFFESPCFGMHDAGDGSTRSEQSCDTAHETTPSRSRMTRNQSSFSAMVTQSNQDNELSRRH
jgi:hypothetical protein